MRDRLLTAAAVAIITMATGTLAWGLAAAGRLDAAAWIITVCGLLLWACRLGGGR